MSRKEKHPGGDFDCNPYDDPDFKAFVREVHEDLLPKLQESALTISLQPEGSVDVKFAVELGLSIMLDKPIIAVVKPGAKVPNKLALVADRIVEGSIDTHENQSRLVKSIRAVLEEMGEEGKLPPE